MSDAVPVVDHSARMEKVAKISQKVAALLCGENLDDKVSVIISCLVNETIRTPLFFRLPEMVAASANAAIEKLCSCDECKQRRAAQ